MKFLRRAIELLKNVDFGHEAEQDLLRLEMATDLLNQNGIRSEDLDLAISNFKSDPEKARLHLYGPSGRGSNRGAMAHLLELMKQHDPKRAMIRYRDAVYRLIES